MSRKRDVAFDNKEPVFSNNAMDLLKEIRQQFPAFKPIMQKYSILILFTLCFLSAAISENIRIGTVTILQTTNSITLIQDNRTNALKRSESGCDYAYIITTPYIKYGSVYGDVPALPACKGLSPIPWDRSIRKSDFVLFPLFDKNPTCLGVLDGNTGATGRSGQKLIFLDTASNRHLEFSTYDMYSPVWIMGKDHPVGFKTFIPDSVGPGYVSLGLKSRLDMIYSLVDGVFVPNVVLKMVEVRRRYDKTSFNVPEICELWNTDVVDMDRKVGEKLLDAVHYGTILGKHDEVNHLLNMVEPELRKEIKEHFIYCIPTNSPAGTAAPYPIDNIQNDTAKPCDFYLTQIRTIMYNAWQQPSSLAGKQGLITHVLVRVQQDGKIVQKKMLNTSGDSLMDASVMTAVKSVKEVPKLPSGFGDAYKDITIDFELNDPNEANNLLAIPTNSTDVTNPATNTDYDPEAVFNPTVNGLTAFEYRGNIFVKDQAGKVTRLTSFGKNREPLISPDGKNIVFLRKSKNTAIDDLSDGSKEQTDFADQIWIVDLKTGKDKCLVSDEDKTPREGGFTRNRAYIIRCRFSPDGSKLYFLTNAALTTHALYVVDIRTHKDRFFMYALDYDVIYTGKYKNHLIVQMHKYFSGGGSYNWHWLVNEKGREIDAIAEEESAKQMDFFKFLYKATTSY